MTTLYLKYRPQKISELDLSEVRDLLSKIVSSGDVPHAFLFEGPRGSGKTSAARIIAKVLNCEHPSKDFEPCNTCEQCISITKGTNIDVIELDAASHRGIDDVRLIRESVKLAPAKAKKKVYIIDEAHMLTTEASNALLKTLEEPPNHVVFILATTNPEKLLDTIKSRTVRVNFKKATPSEIVKSLSNVLEKEKRKYQKEVLELISKNVDGSFRDAKKVLEEIIIKEALEDLSKAQNYLLNKADFDIGDFIEKLYRKDLKGCIGILNNAEIAGVSSRSVYNQMLAKIKSMLFSLSGYTSDEKPVFNKTDLISFSDTFITFWSRYQNDVADYIPLYLFATEWCGDKSIKGGQIDIKSEPSERSPKSNETKKTSSLSESENTVSDRKSEEIASVDEGIKKTSTSDSGVVFDNNFSEDLWKQILSYIRSKNASTEALLRASKPVSFDGKKLTLGVFYKFHKEKLESIPHKSCLEDGLRGATGLDISVECFLTEPPSAMQKKEAESTGNNMSFNGNGGQHTVTGNVVLSETEDNELLKLAEEVFGS